MFRSGLGSGFRCSFSKPLPFSLPRVSCCRSHSLGREEAFIHSFIRPSVHPSVHPFPRSSIIKHFIYQVCLFSICCARDKMERSSCMAFALGGDPQICCWQLVVAPPPWTEPCVMLPLPQKLLLLGGCSAASGQPGASCLRDVRGLPGQPLSRPSGFSFRPFRPFFRWGRVDFALHLAGAVGS